MSEEQNKVPSAENTHAYDANSSGKPESPEMVLQRLEERIRDNKAKLAKKKRELHDLEIVRRKIKAELAEEQSKRQKKA